MSNTWGDGINPFTFRMSKAELDEVEAAMTGRPMTSAQPGQEQRMELKACPGCGKNSTRVIGGPNSAGGLKYWAGCDYCRWRTWGNTSAEAIAAWNTRPTADLGEDGELVALLGDGEWWQTVVRGPNPTSFSRDLTHIARQARDRLILYREALATTIERVEYASGMFHNSQQWHSEDAPDGSGTLWDWVFAPAALFCLGVGDRRSFQELSEVEGQRGKPEHEENQKP